MDAGLSMRALAERADVSFTTISRIENNKLDPTFSTVEKLFSAMGETLQLRRRRAKPVPRLADLTDAWSVDATGRDQPDWTRLRAFADYLFRHPSAAKTSILAAPVPSGSPLLDNVLAGIAEKIADDNGLHRPAWTKRVPALQQPWEGVGTSRMRAAARAATPAQFVARNVFIPAGTIWRLTYILLKGRVLLRLPAKPGEFRMVIASIAEGEMFGLSPLLGSAKYTSEAQCAVPSEVLAIDAQELRGLLQADCLAGFYIMNEVAQAYFTRYIELLGRLPGDRRPDPGERQRLIAERRPEAWAGWICGPRFRPFPLTFAAVEL